MKKHKSSCDETQWKTELNNFAYDSIEIKLAISYVLFVWKPTMKFVKMPRELHVMYTNTERMSMYNLLGNVTALMRNTD